MMDHSQVKIRARPTKRFHSRRPTNWTIVLLLSVATGATVLAGFASGILSHTPSASVTETASISMPTGAIAESDATLCERLTFDDKGQVVQDTVPCDGSVRDTSGRPVPFGTIRRLDAISKSFAAH